MVTRLTLHIRAASDWLPPRPPLGTGNRKLIDLNREHGFDIQRALKDIADQNVSAGSTDMTIKQIACQNEMAPAEVYALVRKVAES